MAPSPDSKRRRTASTNNGNTLLLSITNLPHDHLTSILDYLPKTSSALFALALKDGGHDEVSKAAIMMSSSTNEYWETLDFADIGDLAARLTDEHIRHLLLLVDAKKKLKKISLTGCNKLVGYGLEPLCGSVVLERICIDLTMERMSTLLVTSVLNSIIKVDGNNSLREIEIHNNVHAQNDSSLRKFLVQFEDLLYFGNCPSCEEANEIKPASMACFECSRYTCDGCNNSDGGMWLRTCEDCDLTFCTQHGAECSDCETFHCPSCKDDGAECSRCGTFHCTSCKNEGAECYSCDTFHCQFCTRHDHVDSAISCARSCSGICFECTLSNGGTECEHCDGLHFPTLISKYYEKNLEINTLRNKNGEITEKNQELTEENKQLRLEIEELRKKLSSGLGILS